MMRLNIRRHALIAFLLALGCGVGLWYVLAHFDGVSWRPFHSRSASLSEFFHGNDPKLQVSFAPCESVEQVTGLSNVKMMTLREGPYDGAAIVADKTMRYPFELLGATRDFIRVSYPSRAMLDWMKEEGNAPASEVEGWTRWGEIIPDKSALVLDTETGAIVSRLLLPSGTSKVAFSTDGQRAIFYSHRAAREVLTPDYSTARCLHVPLSLRIGALFYQPDGALYAAVFASDDNGNLRNSQMNVVRVSPTGGPSQPTEIAAVASDFRVSDDGRTGFILHQTEDWRREVDEVEVVDLQALKVRNSFNIDCDRCSPDFTINSSGSELYLKPYASAAIQVIDTHTGRLVRELPYRTKAGLSKARVVGDSLYLEDSSASYPQPMVLINSAGMTKANPLIMEAIKTGGALFNLNRERTRLLKLDADGQVQDSFWIERPEVKLNPEAAGYVFVDGPTATPDSKRLLLFFTYSYEASVILECSSSSPHSKAMKH